MSTPGRTTGCNVYYLILWVRMNTQLIRVTTAIRSVSIAVTLAMAALLVFTHNFITAFLATLTIVCVCVMIMGNMYIWGYTVGNTESICLIILAGFCVDYIVHMGHSYVEAADDATVGASDRVERVHFAMRNMGVSVLSSAITSLGASFVLMLCTIVFFTTFGTFFSARSRWLGCGRRSSSCR